MAVEAQTRLAVLDAKDRATARQDLREFCCDNFRDFLAGQRIGLIAHQRQSHEGHIGGAGVQFDIAIPKAARFVPVDTVTDDFYRRFVREFL